jgi:mannose-6-phosphate isomerase-like protein (cupin superfamily)
MAAQPIDIAAKLAQFTDLWTPKVVARMNDYEIKVVKLDGEFIWHHHDDTDELFLVVDGDLVIQMRDGDVAVRPGQLYVVPRGVEHCPIAVREVHAVLIEPAGVANTCNAGGPRTAGTDASLA